MSKETLINTTTFTFISKTPEEFNFLQMLQRLQTDSPLSQENILSHLTGLSASHTKETQTPFSPLSQESEVSTDHVTPMALDTSVTLDSLNTLKRTYDAISPSSITNNTPKKPCLEGRSSVSKKLDFGPSLLHEFPESDKKQSYLKMPEAAKKSIEKPKICNYFQTVTEVKSDKIVVNIICDQGKDTKCIILGQPKVIGGGKLLMRHTTPWSVPVNAVMAALKNSPTLGDAFYKLLKLALIFPDNKSGFCFNNQDLESSPYKNISGTLKTNPNMVHKSLFNKDIKYSFVNPSHDKILFNTPTKKNKAQQEFTIKNKVFIQASLIKLKNAIGEQDPNAFTIALEELTKYILILFNQQKDATFPTEGNTLEHEIRLYKSKRKAANPEKYSYTVMTSKEIKAMIDNNDELSGLIRIVKCEGNRVQKMYKGLTLLDQIIKEYNLCGEAETQTIKPLLKKFNQEYYFELKLANSDLDPEPYNIQLELKSYKETIVHQIAKLLFALFDFKALEDKVFVPVQNGIEVYTSAEGKNTGHYSIQDGNTYRQQQMNKSTENKKYNKEVTYRTPAPQLDTLAKKAVELLYVGLTPYGGFLKGFMTISLLAHPIPPTEGNEFRKTILNSFTEIIKLDYKLSEEQLTAFDTLVNNRYAQIIELENRIELSEDYDINILGEDYGF